MKTLFYLLSIPLILVSCDKGPSTSSTPRATDVALPATITLVVGQKQTITPTFTPSEANPRIVSWESLNPDIATVNSRGEVEGIAQGTTQVTITVPYQSGDLSASCSVVVNPGNPVGGNLSGKGIFLSIYAFNNGITGQKGFTLVSENPVNVNELKRWVELLSISNGTSLYYADDQAMDYIRSTNFQATLDNVYLVTWTDGKDISSAAQPGSKYDAPDEYRNAVKKRIETEKFHGLPLNAYGIGVNTENQPDFEQVVRDISSSEDNSYVMNDMDEVSEAFAKIAKDLKTINTSTDLTFTDISNNVDDICFTFDGLPRETSRYKIEATFVDKNNMRLANVSYTGITSSSGNSVQGTNTVNALSDYTFRNIKRLDDGSLSNAKLFRSSLSWSEDVEFDPAENSQTTISQNTIAVVLVLDMSSSLGEAGVEKIKLAAKNFIDVLGSKYVETDEGVQIGGAFWATRNVGSRGTFITNPHDLGDHYNFDDAQTACPYGWRIPTQSEFQNLDSSGSVWTTVNGVNGRRFGVGNNTIFLPAAGNRVPNGAINSLGSYGFYWSSTRSGNTDGISLFLNSSYVRPSHGSSYTSGMTVRCVRQ
jgi:uncharacterized protein (TIGR02145 family)